MYTTRSTVVVARAVAILSATSSFALMWLFLNMLTATGSPVLVCALLAFSAALWLGDTYLNARADFIVRLAVLGAAYGVGATGVALVFA